MDWAGQPQGARHDLATGNVTVELSEVEWKHVGPVLGWLRTQLDVSLPALPIAQPPLFQMTLRLSDAFGLHLRLFHALHSPQEALTKKPFEFALENSAKEAGFDATIDENATTE
jgi:hypothetical protein